jgi:integrase
VLPLLGARRLRDIRPDDVASVVRQTLAKKGMSSKSAKNAYAVFADLLADALARGLLGEDPRALPPDIWPAEPDAPRPSFTAAEVLALTSDERIDAELRIYNSLAFGTGLPTRDVCQLRFGDWPAHTRAPCSPDLTATIERWHRQGFERVYGRPPTAEDWLVPRRSDVAQPHTEGSAYKAFRRCCVTLGIKTRSPNAIRNTFENAKDGHRGDPALH